MEAGHELDVLMAEKIMGWSPVEPWKIGPDAFSDPGDSILVDAGGRRLRGWSPSTNVSDAIMVAEKVGISLIRLDDGRWIAGASTHRIMYTDDNGDHFSWYEVKLDDDNCWIVNASAPLAICLAALRAENRRLDGY